MVRPALIELILARWRGFLREPGAVFWTFGFPVVLAVVLGVAFKNRPPEPVVCAVEEGPGADALMSELATSREVKAYRLPVDAARVALHTGKVALVVVGDRGAHTYRFDPTRPESRLARALVDDALERAEGREDKARAIDERVTEPGARYIDFLLPGLIGMGLMSSGLWGIGYVLVDMRTKKLIKRLVATPMSRIDFLLGFVLTRAIFLVLELPVLLAFGALVFDVPMRGSIVLLTLIATLGSLVFAGLGLLVASRAQNTQTVSGLINLVTMPMFLASGTFFSSEKFPRVVLPIVRALPLTALNDALRAVMLEGAGFTRVEVPIAILLAWGLVSFGLALRIFRWS